jgi:hypothetical protein
MRKVISMATTQQTGSELKEEVKQEPVPRLCREGKIDLKQSEWNCIAQKLRTNSTLQYNPGI